MGSGGGRPTMPIKPETLSTATKDNSGCSCRSTTSAVPSRSISLTSTQRGMSGRARAKRLRSVPCAGTLNLSRIARGEQLEQPLRRRADLVHRRVECLLVDARGLAIAAHLAHKLKGGGADFFLASALVTAKRLDTSAHYRDFMLGSIPQACQRSR